MLVPSDSQGLDPYAYAGDNPAGSADPNGLCPVDRCGFGIVNNGTVYRHGPVDPGNSGGAYIPSYWPGSGSYPAASAPAETPQQYGVEIGALPAAGHQPTPSDLTYLQKNYGYRDHLAYGRPVLDDHGLCPGCRLRARGWVECGARDEEIEGTAGSGRGAGCANRAPGACGVAQQGNSRFRHLLTTRRAVRRRGNTGVSRIGQHLGVRG